MCTEFWTCIEMGRRRQSASLCFRRLTVRPVTKESDWGDAGWDWLGSVSQRSLPGRGTGSDCPSASRGAFLMQNHSDQPLSLSLSAPQLDCYSNQSSKLNQSPERGEVCIQLQSPSLFPGMPAHSKAWQQYSHSIHDILTLQTFPTASQTTLVPLEQTEAPHSLGWRNEWSKNTQETVTLAQTGLPTSLPPLSQSTVNF